jgi:2-methylcitrate dehydratase PrpD
MTLATDLAQRIVDVRFAALPADVVHWAKIGIVDTVGVTLAGSGDAEPAVAILERVLPPSRGKSLVFGSARRIGALDAALVNGTAAHVLDFDDCNNTVCGHPSAPVLPALFALADDKGASGEEFIAAYVAGVETECKIALGAGLHQYTHGWHPSATIGVFGASAACARLLRLDADKTATALALATSFAAGTKANFGTMAKSLHVGQATRAGLLAALLAAEGYTARHDAFEHTQGYFEMFNGAGNFDLDAIAAAWANPWDLARPALAIKQYPCCGSTHPALDALLDIVRRHDLEPSDVARIDAWIHKRRLEHTNRPDPRSALDAKFSLQYCLARALTDRSVRIEHFEGAEYLDPQVRAILPRVRVAPYTAAQFPADNHFGAEVHVTTAEGTVLEARVDQALGRSVDAPVPEALLREKFEKCATRVLSAATADAAYRAIRDLEHLPDVTALTRMLEAPLQGDAYAAKAMELAR